MEYTVDHLRVLRMPTRNEMGKRAADDLAQRIRQLENEKEIVHIIFAAAPSQNDVLHHLCQSKHLDWSRVHAYHMDEYLGLPADHPQNFRKLSEKEYL